MIENVTSFSFLAQATDGTLWLPAQRSTIAPDTDWAWNVVLYVSLFFFTVVVGAMVYFTIRYRRRDPNQETSRITHNTPLEIAWSVIPLIIVMWFFVVGFKGWINYDTPPTDAYVISVEAKKWSFNFTYPNGGQSGVLYVPVNTKVLLRMTATDVLHAVYIPHFRIGRNAIPNRTTELWFEATQVSTTAEDREKGYPLFCTQYCGLEHSRMFTSVVVMDKPAFEKKLAELGNIFKETSPNGDVKWLAYADVGARLYKSNGCGQCHSVDGKPGTGPTWKGLWKKDHQFSASNEAGFALAAGDSDEKWAAYLGESIIKPEAKIVAGFQNAMPSYASSFSGTAYNNEKLKAMIEYIKSLGENYDPKKAPLHPDNPANPKNATAPGQ